MRGVCLTAMAAALALVVAAGCASKGDSRATETAIVRVRVSPVTKGSIREVLTYIGSIEPYREMRVVPSVGGKIARIYVDIGDRVAAGQTLAELDNETFSLQLQQAQAGLAVAQANFDDAERNWNRMQELKQKGSVSEQQYEKVQLAYQAAQAQLQQAQAALALAQWQLRHSVMKAPFAGVVTAKYMNEGDMINPQMPGAQGVVTLVDLSRVKIRINASEREVTKLREGLPVEVRVDVFPDQVFAGEVSAVNAAANTATRTFEVQVVVPNPRLELKAGMFARVAVVVASREEALVVPTDALLGTEVERYVYVVEDGIAMRKGVRVGIMQNGLAEVVSGLQEGDQLVVVGQQMLQQGSRVTVEGGE
ncbi:MAG: efflux RND transporter periplasmic adaptor subunit [bacterium]|nr:efflux RND transporter periplasmic adaptor subunit [candidate division KSB1 bacterium]MDH7561398.1 efflux RND transporter periplasmic adaptor subunit [bacterium]